MIPSETVDVDATFDRLTEMLRQQMDTDWPDLSPVIGQLLAAPTAQIDRPEDAAKFLHLLAYLARGPVPEARAWEWATAVAKPHPQHPGVLSLLASLGDLLRMKDNSSVANTIRLADLEAIFQRAMDVTPAQAGAFARAGLFYLNNRNEGQAERCLSRAFELDPQNAFVTIQLSDLYGRTNRPEEGLAVLDRCLREGEADPEVLWKAGLSATSLGRWEPALAYLSQLAGIDPQRRWLQYYRAIALLELKRFAEAAVAIDLEAALIMMPSAMHIHTVRAAIAAGLGQLIALRRHIDDAVAPPLGLVNYLSPAGVLGCFSRLWAAAGQLPVDDPSRLRLRDRLLSSGITPVEFWDQQRAGREKVQNVYHFWVDVRQPIDQRWFRGGSALPAQQNWRAYTIRYGVLAANQTEAGQAALQCQSQSGPLPAEISAIKHDSGPYTDAPGITQRGFPTHIPG